jgi:hypothetical protein
MSEWNDISSFSKGDTDRTPKSWDIIAGNVRLVVTRHIHYDGWVTRCEPFFGIRQLESDAVEEAKKEAKALLRRKLEHALKELGDEQ